MPNVVLDTNALLLPFERLINGMKERKLSIRVAHPITLLAEAYRQREKR